MNVTRRTLRVGLLASIVGLVARTAARAADALTIDKDGDVSIPKKRWSEAGLNHFTRDISSGIFAGPDATDADDRALWSAEREKASRALSGVQIGLIAQEVEPVLPELVREDDKGFKHLRYAQLTAVLVEAVKEQQTLIQSLSRRLAALEPQSQSAR